MAIGAPEESPATQALDLEEVLSLLERDPLLIDALWLGPGLIAPLSTARRCRQRAPNLPIHYLLDPELCAILEQSPLNVSPLRPLELGFFDHAPAAVLTDAAGRVLGWNAAAVALSQISERDALGQELRLLVQLSRLRSQPWPIPGSAWQVYTLVAVGSIYEDIFRQIPIPMAVMHLPDLDDAKTFTMEDANQAGMAVTGLEITNLLGQPIVSWSPEFGQSGRASLYPKIVRSGKPLLLGELQMRLPALPEMAKHWVQLQAFPLPGNRVGLCGIDVTDRRAAEEDLKNKEIFLSSILENLPTMIFLKDAKELRFVLFNRAGEDLLGWKREDLLGRNDYDFFPKEEADFFTKKDREVLAGHAIVDIPEEPIHTRMGLRWLHTRKIPLYDAQGNPTHLLGISVDITDQKQAEESLARKATELARSNAELEQFAYVASHDLREPLRKIDSFIKLIQTDCNKMNSTCIDYLGRIQKSAVRMEKLVTDLLLLARVTTHGHPFLPVQLNDVVQDVLGDLDDLRQRVGGQVEVGALPVVDADRMQMHQLFQNLIANALKFSMPGQSPIVRVSAHPNGEDAWIIEVADNGIGFSEAQCEQLFQPFQRLHGRSYEGTGIGLSICQKIVHRHNGTIRAHGVPHQGATFIVMLPARQPGVRSGGLDGR